MVKSEENYLKLVQASAWYDLVVTAPFAFPIVSVQALAMLRATHIALSLDGGIPAFQAAHLLFMNLMGCLVLVWSVLRLRQPRIEYGLYDAAARFLFAFCQGFYLLGSNLSALLIPFFIMECTFGVLQLYGFYLLKRTGREGGAAAA